MTVGESAGSVYVTVDGDASPLIAKFAQAESASKAAGQKIAAGLGVGLQAGSQQLAIFNALLARSQTEAGRAALAAEQLGQSMRATAAAAAAAATPVLDLQGGIQRLAFAQALVAREAADSVKKLGDEAQGAGFSFRYAFFGVKDLMEGRVKFAVAEAANELVRLGPQAIAAGVAIGAVGYAAYKLGDAAGLWHVVTEEEKKATEEAAKYEKELHSIYEQTAKLKAQQFEIKFGALASGGNQVAAGDSDAQVKGQQVEATLDLVEAKRQEIRHTNDALTATDLDSDAKMTQIGILSRQKAELEELTKTLAKLRAEEEQLKQGASTDATKLIDKELDLSQKQRNDQIEEDNRAATEARRAFDEKASQAQELARIGERQLKETLEEGKQRNELLRFNMQQEERYAKEQEKLQEEAVKKAEQLAIQRGHAQNIGALGHVAVGEVEAKGAGESEELAIEGRKIALEAQYSAQLLHTSQQQIQYLRQIADLERQASDAKIAGVVAERQIAEAEAIAAEAKLAAAQLSGDGGVAQAEELAAALKKVAELTQQINALEQRGANQQAQAQGRVSTAQAQASPRAQLAGILSQWGNVKEQMNQGALEMVRTLEKVPQTLARAIVQGRGLGQAFKSMGKELATALLTDALKTGLSAVIHGLGQVIPLFARLTGAATAAAAAQKAVALASVATAAGEGAAWGFESVMAALPFPANIAVAPEVAAATFASIMGFGAFAAGTDFAPGGMALVGERGPEIVNLPRGSQVIPNHMLGSVPTGGAIGSHVSTSSTSTSNSSALHIGEAHFHGVQNVQQLADAMYRQIPRVAKNRTATQSPYSR